MLERLELKDVGPAAELHFDFCPRINIVTGDNGVGKSFVLDVAWWALTRTWAGYPANPQRGAGMSPRISFAYQAKVKRTEQEYEFDFKAQTWRGKPGRPANPGMVIYARADGSFSVWDPARNYWKNAPSRDVDTPDRPEAYHFSPKQVWDGLRDGDRHLCNGLIADWVSWQKEGGAAFSQLASVLEVLAPSEAEPLRPGKPLRISLEDVRDMPSLEMPYGTVPLVYASAGMKRIAALAYLLVWTWQEHQQASRLLNQKPTNEITFLIDEIEAHLHPHWQRVILPALLKVMQTVTNTQIARVQTIVATHAPLLLASVEPIFDEEQDRVFTFDLDESAVTLRTVAWSKQGDAVNWLVSDVFGLKQARSREAERAIEAAEAFMRGERQALPEDLKTWEEIHRELQRVLPGHDAFWPRWIVKGEASGNLRP
jgi:predicted ATPase